MSVETAFRRLGNANPVPDPASLRERRHDAAVFLATTQKRNPTMATGQRKEIEPTSTKPVHDRNRRSRLLIGAAAAVLVLIVGIGTLAMIGGDEDAAVDPVRVIEDYAVAYNAGDIDRLVELFTNESVVDTGDAMFGGPFTGREQIRTHLVRELDKAAEVDALQISKVQVSGNTVTWDQALTLSGGDQTYCSEGSSAVVEDGSIVSLKLVLAQQSC
jgi:ketosteroid isomerase-like protein